jgi:uncharacterized protein YciI
MQFLVLAYDNTDADAPARRQAHRPAHIDNINKAKADGHLIVGGAMLNDAGAMIGSALILDFADHAALDAWLRADPFSVERVWDRFEITPYRVAVTGYAA